MPADMPLSPPRVLVLSTAAPRLACLVCAARYQRLFKSSPKSFGQRQRKGSTLPAMLLLPRAPGLRRPLSCSAPPCLRCLGFGPNAATPTTLKALILCSFAPRDPGRYLPRNRQKAAADALPDRCRAGAGSLQVLCRAVATAYSPSSMKRTKNYKSRHTAADGACQGMRACARAVSSSTKVY